MDAATFITLYNGAKTLSRDILKLVNEKDREKFRELMDSFDALREKYDEKVEEARLLKDENNQLKKSQDIKNECKIEYNHYLHPQLGKICMSCLDNKGIAQRLIIESNEFARCPACKNGYYVVDQSRKIPILY